MSSYLSSTLVPDLIRTVSNLIHRSKSYKCVNLNPTGGMGMQPAESNRGQHPVCCHLLDSAGWVLILQSSYRGALRAPYKWMAKLACNWLNPTTCIPKQVVGFRLTHLYYIDLFTSIMSGFNTFTCKYFAKQVYGAAITLMNRSVVYMCQHAFNNLLGYASCWIQQLAAHSVLQVVGLNKLHAYFTIYLYGSASCPLFKETVK